MRSRQVLLMATTLALLFWLWPNFVHEPLHAIALWMQGVDAQIVFDFGWPAHPYIGWLGDMSVEGYIFFLSLPTIFSVVCMLVISRMKAYSVVTHISVPIYLTLDAVVNVANRVPTSDFRWLHEMPYSQVSVLFLSICMMVWCGAIVADTFNVLKERREKQKVILRCSTSKECGG